MTYTIANNLDDSVIYTLVNRLKVNNKNLLFNLPCISVSFTVLSPLRMYCVFAMHNYNNYMQMHHSKSNCHRYIPRSKRQHSENPSSLPLSQEFSSFLTKREVTQINYSVFELFFHLPSYKKCTHGFPNIQFDAILHVHAFSMFLKEIHVGDYGS